MHFRAAEFFSGSFLADRGLHQCGACQKKSGTFGHQDVIAHDGKICATGYTHAHDRGELRNAHGGHDGVVAKDAAKIVGIGKNVFLKGEKNAGRIDEVDCRKLVFDGDVLRAYYFLGGHWEECGGFYGGVIGDDHEETATNSGEAGDSSCGGSAAPFFVHFECGKEA